MLPKKQRLQTADFTRPFRVVFKNSAFSVKIRKNTLPHSRFAVVVGSRVDKRAVVRNRLRRFFFEKLSLWRETGYDVMVLVAPLAKNIPREALRKSIEEARKVAFSHP